MRTLAIPGLIFTAGMWLNSIPLRALPEYTEKEKKDCAFCHPGGDLFTLNDAGRYYAEHHSFEGYEDPKGPNPEPAGPKPEPVKPKP